MLRAFHGLIDNDDKFKVASSKSVPNSGLECHNHTLFETKMAKIDTLFLIKTAKKTYLYIARKGSAPRFLYTLIFDEVHLVKNLLLKVFNAVVNPKTEL